MNSSRGGPPVDSTNGVTVFLFYIFIAALFFYLGKHFDHIKQRFLQNRNLNRASKVCLPLMPLVVL